MIFHKDRLIVHEDNFGECKFIKKKVQAIFDNHILLKGKGLVAEVDFEDSMWNEGTNIFWHEYTIRAFISGELVLVLNYTTDGTKPDLVYKNGMFEFYYVFKCSNQTCTHPAEVVNLGMTDNTCDFTLEDVIITELNINTN